MAGLARPLTPPAGQHGLIVGKFYPPHRGHQYLIETAARECAVVTVLVMAAQSETISLADRVTWLRDGLAAWPSVHVTGVPCDVPVDYGDQEIWAAQVAVMRAALDRDARPPVDLVFSSEPYGAELAGWFGAAHRCVDASRQAVPVAAASIRADLPGRWTDLTPPARAGLAARVVVLGAESTGTTTVARELTRHYRARGAIWAQTGFVPEYGRPYTAQKLGAVRAAAAAAGRAEPEVTDLTWTAADFDAIAAAQTQSENEAAAAGSPLLVCDTDAFATYVWERRYLGTAARAPQPWAVGQLPRRAIYLLTSHEGVPWQGDGLREGDLAIRAAMTGWFAAALTSAGHSWVPLAGPLAGRLRLALAVTDEILAWQQRFGPPITAAPAPTTGGRA